MVRPIATHNRDIDDYGSWRGLMVMSAATGRPAVERAPARPANAATGALWARRLRRPLGARQARGEGGPWKDTSVRAGEPSDPYLMTGFSDKTLRVSHDGPASLHVRVEIDLTGTGLWAQ